MVHAFFFIPPVMQIQRPFSRSGEGGAKRRMWDRDGSRIGRDTTGSFKLIGRSNPTSGPSDHLLPMGEGRFFVESDALDTVL